MARRRRRNLSAEVLTISVLVALFFLAGLSGLLWAAGSGVFSGPTPTPTATLGATATPTADWRATRVQEDILTQVAYSVELATLAARSLAGGSVGDGAPGVVVTLFPDVPAAVTPAETAVANVLLPVISQADAALATALAATAEAAAVQPPPESPLSTPVALPIETETPVTQTVNLPLVDQGGLPPTFTPTPVDTPTETLTPSPTPLPPTETPTPPPPTPTIPYVVQSMRAVVDRQNADFRVGPSTLYTQTGTLAVGTQITLLARDATGDWLFACCLSNNAPGWIRGATARPIENPTLPAPLSDESPNNVRWLVQRGPEAGLTPIPAATPAATADWPMARRDRANSGQVAVLPQLPLQSGWPLGSQAGLAAQSYVSGAIVAGSSVMAASADGHLYSFDKESGSQRWRYNLGEIVRMTPLAENGLVYVMTESGRLVALEDQGLAAVLRWDQRYSLQPRGGLIASLNRILLTGRHTDGSERLLIVDRGTGSIYHSIQIPQGTPQMPAAGGQLVYVASDTVRAYDIFNGALVWQSGEAVGYSSPPVYAAPGVEALAELYVADLAGRVWAFDATTGFQIWVAPIGGQATGLAVNRNGVYATGAGFVRALAREQRDTGQLLWNVGIGGNVLGGAVADETRLFVATDGGAFQYLDALTGALIVGNVQSPSLGGAVAISGPWIFAPSQSGVLFAARETPF